ncbi:MAG: CpaF family protein [Anaerolineales bacterium]|nr:CpaF family protein [Anaerolineales bacterium]
MPSQPSTPAGGGAGEDTASKLAELRMRRVSPPAGGAATTGTGGLVDLKLRVQNKLLSELDPSMDISRTAEVRKTIEDLYENILAEEGIVLSRTERKRLFDSIVSEILGLGPLEPLLQDETITEVMVNGPKNVFIERRGKIERAPVIFESNEHVLRIIDRIMSPLGRRIDESHPYEDARLMDGSRVNAIVPPIALCGPTLTIRKFFKKPLTIEKLVEYGSVTMEAVEFIRACVTSACNVIIAGGTGSGKTTFLNVMSSFIPADERIITIENAAELQLRQEHVVGLESRPANIEGRGEVTIRDLVVNSLRMRPDRIVVGEIRDGAALDMLQAMNTGHEGSMTTLHSNSARDAMARLETMCLMAGMDLPVRAIREQIASAINIIVHLGRLPDGSRRVLQIAEVQGMEGDVITMADIFMFEQTGYEKNKVIGRLRPTGLRPRVMERIEEAGIHLPASVFGVGERGRY